MTREKKIIVLGELVVAYGLIMATIWTARGTQRVLFYITAVWFFVSALIAVRRGQPLGLKRLPLRMTLVTAAATILIATAMMATAAELGTLHGLFGVRAPLLHASTYLLWSLVQQYIQQSFFFVRIEQLTSGMRASFITACLFGLVHLPNPVLTLVTFIGGWILCELFRHYRSLYPLAITHGVIGLAIAVSVPDSIHHHMRVGLGYLRYPN